MTYKLLVNFEVKMDQVDSFVDMLQTAKATIASQPGCLGVELLQDTESSNKIVLAEIWKTKEIHDEFAEKMQQAGSMDNLAQFLSAAPRSDFFHIL